MRILVAGAAGFLGSHLVRRLLAEGCQVAILTRADSSMWRIADILPSVRVMQSDLLNLTGVGETLREFAPQVVVHLAWQGVGHRYRNDPKGVSNLQATLNLLELGRQVGCTSWVGLGSQAEYGVWNRAINEETPTTPTTLYGATKLCACFLTQQFCMQAGMRFVWLRLFSAYGPADNREWLIPYVILTLLHGEMPALTEGTQNWDYLYVEDAVRAIYQTIVSQDANGIYNLGSGVTRTVRTVVEQIRDLIDPRLPLGFGQVPFRTDQIVHLQADISRLQGLGWSPEVKFENGLQRTVDWFKENPGRFAP